MTFLASAIPGFRAIRAPLVAGYLWLVVAWLYFDPGVDFHKATGVEREIVNLGKTVGPVGTAAGVSVAAYLLGSLSQGVTETTFNLLRNIWNVGRGWRLMMFPPKMIEPAPSVSESQRRTRLGRFRATHAQRPRERNRFVSATSSALGHLVLVLLPGELQRLTFQRRERRQQEEDLSLMWAFRDDDVDAPEDPAVNVSPAPPPAPLRALLSRLIPDRYPNAEAIRDGLSYAWPRLSSLQAADISNALRQLRFEMKQELKLPVTILAGGEPGAYAEADRLRSEAEFRFALGPPLVGLVWLFATDVTAWCWALLVVPYLLYSQGSGYSFASSFLVDEVRARTAAPSPALEKFQRRLAFYQHDSADGQPERASVASDNGL